MSSKYRAVTNQQKTARRQLLMDIAWELFQTQPYATIHMNDVARVGEVAKGTVYLYFATKEALFLAVLEKQFGQWFDQVDAALGAGETPLSGSQLAELLADSLRTRPHLTRLLAIAHVILEQNIDRATAYAYKQMLRARVEQTGARIEARVPRMQPGQGSRFLLRVYAVVIGLEHMARPAKWVAEALAEDEELAFFQIDFTTEFVQIVQRLIDIDTPDLEETREVEPL